jgi:AAHS family 4-hydroxybenzoate transporter-like MFS transporter
MASSVAVYFVNSWGPIVLEAMHYPRNTAAIATSFGGIMGSVAGLAIMRVTDRRGSITVLFYPLLLLPVMLTLGLVAMGSTAVLLLAMLVLMLVGGMHFAFMSIISGLYPTAIRGRGAGWASSMGKFGGVLGPAIGGAILASGLPIVRSYAILAVCPFIVIVCAAAITRIRAKRDAG